MEQVRRTDGIMRTTANERQGTETSGGHSESNGEEDRSCLNRISTAVSSYVNSADSEHLFCAENDRGDY